MFRFQLCLILLSLSAISACDTVTVGDDDPDSGPDTDSNTGTSSFSDGCDKLGDFCLDRPFWTDFGITSPSVCQETFACAYAFYEGDQACQNKVMATIECAANITGESGCEACEDLAVQISSSCAFAEGCI